MRSLTQFGRLITLVAVMLVPLIARAQTDQQAVVDRATKTVADLAQDKAFGNARDMLRKARGVLIVPRLYKGGFIIGGEGGTGVLLARGQNGSWSNPAFYALGSASFGFQAGLEQSEVVLLVMTQKGPNALLRDQFKVAAQAGISIANLGSGVEGAANLGGADIVVWSSSSGVYAGVALNGSIIRPDTSDDRAYYGRPVTTREILSGRGLSAPHAADLRRGLGALG